MIYSSRTDYGEKSLSWFVIFFRKSPLSHWHEIEYICTAVYQEWTQSTLYLQQGEYVVSISWDYAFFKLADRVRKVFLTFTSNNIFRPPCTLLWIFPTGPSHENHWAASAYFSGLIYVLQSCQLQVSLQEVTSLRFILKQPSPEWKTFGIEVQSSSK